MLDQTRGRLVENETILNDLTVIKEAEAVVSTAEQILQQERRKLREIENQVKDQKYKIEQNESTLYSGRIHNPKELQDLQNDVAALKRYLAVLEDRQLEAMLAVEDYEANFTQASNAAAQARGHFEEQHAHLRAEKTNLLGTIDRYEIERQTVVIMVQPQDQTLYDNLRKIRSGVAVAHIIDKSCSACGSMLTPALVQSASSATQLARCTSCGRVLYAG